MEHIVSFGERSADQDRPFYIEMAGITYPDTNYHITRTTSPIYCFEYVISGSGIVEVDGITNYPCGGDLYILPKYSDQNYRSAPDDPFQKIWMNVSGSLCDELVHVYGLTGVLIVKHLDVYSIFREFLDVCENKELSLDEIYSQSSLIFHKLIMAISKRISQDKSIGGAAGEIKSYIDRNIYEPLSIERIAKHISLSPSQINRVFKSSYGVTPYDYILSRKIDTAKLLLQNTTLTIKEIAYRLNFADEHYFSNVFLQKTGVRPSKF